MICPGTGRAIAENNILHFLQGFPFLGLCGIFTTYRVYAVYLTTPTGRVKYR